MHVMHPPPMTLNAAILAGYIISDQPTEKDGRQRDAHFTAVPSSVHGEGNAARTWFAVVADNC